MLSALRIAAWTATTLILLGSVSAGAVGLPLEKQKLLPPPARVRVDFARDIQPIFEASCVQCHARGKDKGGFSLQTKADFLEGGDTGTPAVAGKSAESLIIDLVSGLDPESVMPKKGKKLTPEQVGLVRAWIDQGMAWPDQITFFKHEPANLRAHPEIQPPANPKFANPLDRYVDRYFAQKKIAWPQPVNDRAYARRVWLDAIGLLPPADELEAFVADAAPDKRERLVQRLLGDSQRYAEHWLTFWNDLLRNDYRGTGYIDGGRKPITPWLYSALVHNLPYDKFVAELVNPGAEAEGFTRGILWRGAVNASMVPPMQAAQSVAQVFLGVNLKCASCHDSFINEYTLNDSYGLAAIYADGPLEIAECDKPTGHIGQVKFLYEELGGIDAEGDALTRKRQLMEAITGQKNGRLPRTIVNRLWQRFMGTGLVEPVDEMDKPAWSPEIIDWLAEDMVAHGYDVKHTMAQILTSRAYQLPTVNVGETHDAYVFRGPAVKRMSAEEFSDALMTLAGMTYAKSDAKVNREAFLGGAGYKLPLTPKWIWTTEHANVKAKPATVVFRKTITLSGAPTDAWFAIAGDDNYSVKINGKNGGSSARRNSTGTNSYEVKSQFQAGVNEIEITSANLGPDDLKVESQKEIESPAGLILYARIRVGDEVSDFVTDASWTATVNKEEARVIELGGVDLGPWRLGQTFLDLAATGPDQRPVERAALLAADPLMLALGRPNREQVVTVRADTATTLQALELTNGATLATRLKQAAEKIVATGESAPAVVQRLFVQAVSRAPTARELTMAEKLVGTPVRAEGVEDLLWSVAMLPEFQLIH
jgi:mono/diheme cytochrome c family protein